MPFLHLRLAGLALTDLRRQTLQRRLTDLTAQHLGKRHDLTAVLIEEIAVAGWAVGAAPVPVAAHLEIAVTEAPTRRRRKPPFWRRSAC